MADRPAGSSELLPLRLPRHTVRARLALFYFAVFLVSGAVLLAATVGLWQGSSTVRATTVAAVPRPALGSRSPVHAALPQAAQQPRTCTSC